MPRPDRTVFARARSGDSVSRSEIVAAYLPRVAAVARAYGQVGAVERFELLQEGVVGLLRAGDRYDPDRGVEFWTYGSWWVRQAMQQLVAELGRPLVLSDRALRHLARLRRAHQAYMAEQAREPSLAELAELTGLSRDHVEALVTVQNVPRSLDEPVERPHGDADVFGDLLVDPRAEEAYERLLPALDGEQARQLLGRLTDRKRTIVEARHLDGSATLAELGARLGVSAERVRQLEQRALGKLRAAA